MIASPLMSSSFCSIPRLRWWDDFGTRVEPVRRATRAIRAPPASTEPKNFTEDEKLYRTAGGRRDAVAFLSPSTLEAIV